MFATASTLAAPAISTSTTAGSATTNSRDSDSKRARDAVFASAPGFGASSEPWSSKVNLAGAQPVADTESLDALFELLSSSDSDPLRLDNSNGLSS